MPKVPQYDTIVLLGRFQPFHLGHQTVIRKALDLASQVLILCGSTFQPRSLRNPWNFQEREEMIRGSFTRSDNQRLIVKPVIDVIYNNNLWRQNVNKVVAETMGQKPGSIGFIISEKPSSYDYGKLFSTWKIIAIKSKPNINATSIRKGLFTKPFKFAEIARLIPANVQDFLEKFSAHEDCSYLRKEQDYYTKYWASWECAPFPYTQVTADALVTHLDKILMVRRGIIPGRGQISFPGGFIEPREHLADACIRELCEETNIRVPKDVLHNSIKDARVFSDPYRAARGRIITHSFHISLDPSMKQPRVDGGDDAKAAFWVPISEVDPSQVFEDHYFVMQNMFGIM